MDNKDAELDRLRSAYKSAVDTWVAAIRAEEALASGDHSLREADKWEADLAAWPRKQHKTRATKGAHEEGIWSKFFGL
jgi:hypothetical protein